MPRKVSWFIWMKQQQIKGESDITENKGLLLTYRHKNKLKDRTQEVKDDEKNKKESKPKPKKLFPKFKEKQNVTTVRNKKNEPILDDIDEKMGVNHSSKKRNANTRTCNFIGPYFY